MRVLGIAGSLRRGSYNRKLIAQALDEARALGADVENFDLITIPFYNQDVEDQGTPQSVLDFKEAVRLADLILIAMPEYNHSISGVLKNALDWASREKSSGNVFDGKIVAVFGASNGRFGTARGQIDLRKVLSTLNTIVVPHPLVYVTMADDDAFDKSGRLKDQKISSNLAKLVARGVEIATKLKS